MIGAFGGVYYIEQAGPIDWHSHDFDHISVLMKGRCAIEWRYPDELWEQLSAAGKLGGRSQSGTMKFTAPAGIPVLAGVEHRFTGEDFLLYCVHATRDAEGIVIGAHTLTEYLGNDNV